MVPLYQKSWLGTFLRQNFLVKYYLSSTPLDLEAAVSEAVTIVTVEFESKVAEEEAAASYEDDTEEESVAGLE